METKCRKKPNARFNCENDNGASTLNGRYGFPIEDEELVQAIDRLTFDRGKTYIGIGV